MKTIDKLQAHLVGEVKNMRDYTYKEVVSRIKCGDGALLSVQASKHHYCDPRENTGPYNKVEVWCVTAPVTEFEYDEDEPSAYVPIEKVVEFIDNHGGM